MRQEIERKIATAALDSLLKKFLVSVDNGGNDGNEYEITDSCDKVAILAAMFKTDDERLYVRKVGSQKMEGWVYLVYGNDGWDVISDYTTNLEEYVGEGSEAYKISEHYSG
jgi:hypothetical protein